MKQTGEYLKKKKKKKQSHRYGQETNGYQQREGKE